MSKPSSFVLKLIEKITRASIEVEALRRTHPDTCPFSDITGMPGKCTCGASDYNHKLDNVLSHLKIE